MEPLDREEALRFLAASPVAHLGVVSDGKPYVTPMSFILDDGRLMFRTLPGRKLEAIRANPAVSIEASEFDMETGEWVSVIVTGAAHEADEDVIGERAISLLLDKYAPALGSPLGRGGLQPMAGFPHVVVVEIEDVTGMVSGGGLLPRTRPGRL
jgi:hypothetical protein